MSKLSIFRKIIVFFLITFSLLFFACAGAGEMTSTSGKQAPSIANQKADAKVVNILFMGIDARSSKENSRSDTMILASIDTQNKKLALLWIPRDTRIEDSAGYQAKINSVNFVQGPDAACKTVGQLLGTRVDYYAVVNFWGFVNIINTLGGVDMNIETNMYHYDPNPLLNINIHKGLQHLDGADALRYMRYRGMANADIGRTEDQAKLIKAMTGQIFQAKTILKLPQLIPELLNSIHTNIPLDDILSLIKSGTEFQNHEIITQTLPGYSFTDPRDGGSYWQADPALANGIIESLLDGQHYNVYQPQPASINQKSDSPANSSGLTPASNSPSVSPPATPGLEKAPSQRKLPDGNDQSSSPPSTSIGNGSNPAPAASGHGNKTLDSPPTADPQSTSVRSLGK